MKLDLRISATCANVKNIFIEPVVLAKLRCSNDHVLHDKPVNITSDSIKRNIENQVINFKVKCKSCRRDMQVIMSIDEKNKYEIWLDFAQTKRETLYLSEMNNKDYIVAQFKTNGCTLEEIENLKINVLATDDSLFKEIDIENEYWAENMSNKKIVSVKSLKWELVQVKGNIK